MEVSKNLVLTLDPEETALIIQEWMERGGGAAVQVPQDIQKEVKERGIKAVRVNLDSTAGSFLQTRIMVDVNDKDDG